MQQKAGTFHPTANTSSSRYCTAAIVLSPYMSTNWVPLPCDEKLEGVLNLCEEQTGSSLHSLTPTNFSLACPRNWVSYGDACFTLRTEDLCKQCVEGSSYYLQSSSEIPCYRLNMSQYQHFLWIWGMVVKKDRLYVKDKLNTVLHLQKFRKHLQNMSTWYDIFSTKAISFDVAFLSDVKHHLCMAEMYVVDSCFLYQHAQCGKDECILHKYICDGVEDCTDGSDETTCPSKAAFRNNCDEHNQCESSLSYFQCKTNGSLPLAKVCDFHMDCSDNSDETSCIHPLCPDGMFTCSNGQCILGSKRCDLMADCIDHTDETKCELDITNVFICHSGLAIPFHYQNDLWPDCENGEDEQKSQQMLELFYSLSSMPTSACQREAHLPCLLGTETCFPAWAICLFDHDEFGSLKYCRNGAHLGNCSSMQCIGAFKCPDSFCLPLHKLCDGQADCLHGEDEASCGNFICPVGSLKCRESIICVHQHYVCDEKRHCPKGDDELYCLSETCPNGCTCAMEQVRCVLAIDEAIPSFPSYMRVINLESRSWHHVLGDLTAVYALTLRLNGLLITRLHKQLFEGTPNVRNLSLYTQSEVIEPRAFSRMPYLEYIRLDNNPITRLAPFGFSGLSSLLVVNLSGISVARLQSNVFHSLPNLQTIIMRHSALKYISRQTFCCNLQSLRQLDLCGTQLLMSGEVLEALLGLPSTLTVLSENPSLCAVVSILGMSCSMTTGLSDQTEFNIGVTVALFGAAVMCLMCAAVSITWHSRQMKKSYSLVAFNLALSNACRSFYLIIIAGGSVLRSTSDTLERLRWSNGWMCYWAMALAHTSLLQTPLLLGLISLKRCLVVVKPFSTQILAHSQIRSIVLCFWLISLSNSCVPWAILLLHDPGISFSTTNNLCLMFSRVDIFGTAIWLVYGLQLSIFAVSWLVMLNSSILVMQYHRSVGRAVRSSNRFREKQFRSLCTKVITEITINFFAWVGLALSFSFQLDIKKIPLKVFMIQTAVIGETLRTILDCVLHTILSSQFSVLCYRIAH